MLCLDASKPVWKRVLIVHKHIVLHRKTGSFEVCACFGVQRLAQLCFYETSSVSCKKYSIYDVFQQMEYQQMLLMCHPLVEQRIVKE